MNSSKLQAGCSALFLAAASLVFPCAAQSTPPGGPLDPARDPAGLHRPDHHPLAEQYIWTAGDAAALRPDHARFIYRDRNRKIEPHAFRGWFTLHALPPAATLYVAGPRSVNIWLNGELILDASADMQSPLGTHVFRAGARSALRIGRNLLAIEAVRGPGIVAASDSPVVQQLAYGESLVAKIVPAAPGRFAPPIATTNAAWRSAVATPANWQTLAFDDRTWPLVQSLGAIESSVDFFQWNTDAGMYDWPGYGGLSPYLRVYNLLPAAASPRSTSLVHADALMHPAADHPFVVQLPVPPPSVSDAPGLLLDFGREIAGRLLIESACNCEAQILVSYGESEGEAISGGHYLGANLIRVPPRSSARGPKSGFRYAWLRFVAGAPQTVFRSIRVEGIAYPVTYRGSFASSDPVLNRIWETSAYTAHLCMQDDIWDAPKRDRGRWAGDLDVAGSVIDNIFGATGLLDQTLTHLIPPAGQDVNGIPGYTALWITAVADLYRHNGDKAALKKKRGALLQLLATMDNAVDPGHGFTNKDHRWLFVDWAPGLFAYTPQAIAGTELEFVRAYREGAWLLGELGDREAADHYHARADALAGMARNQLAAHSAVAGDNWQLNAMAVLAGVAPESDYTALWNSVFQTVAHHPQEQTISPFFNFYLLRAMALMGHRREALEWLRTYWGGMLDEGATSFWESYDLRWPKQNPHLSLQADGTSGYFVSLAHGWSSGPAAWLEEEILGIAATAPGFRTAEVRPDLAGLQWVRGAVPTPRGLLRVDASQQHIAVEVPAATAVTLLLPSGRWLSHGVLVRGEPAENGARLRMSLHTSGRFEFERQ